MIVCANVANLLLAQGADRRKEIGVRIALGAGRLRVVRQLLVESLMLALLGGAGGVLLANWSLPLLLRAGANPFAEFGVGKFQIDGRVLLFTLVVSMASSIIFGIVPALTSTQVEPFETLKNFASGHSSRVRRRRLSNMLVVSELALSLLLMVSGGFVLRSLYQLWSCDWGFPLENRLAISLSLSQRSYAEGAKRKQFFEDLLSQVRALPGVRSAALMRNLPIMMQGAATPIRVERDQGTDDSGPILTASCSSVSPDYWRTFGIPLKKGRLFTERDTSRDVAVVSASMAREVWKGQDPIGRKIEVFRSWYTVVGVCGDAVNLGFARKPEYAIYVPSSFAFDTASLVLHTSGNPRDLVPPVRDIIKRMDPDQPVSAVRSLEQAQAELGEPWEFLLVLLGSIRRSRGGSVCHRHVWRNVAYRCRSNQRDRHTNGIGRVRRFSNRTGGQARCPVGAPWDHFGSNGSFRSGKGPRIPVLVARFIPNAGDWARCLVAGSRRATGLLPTGATRQHNRTCHYSAIGIA